MFLLKCCRSESIRKGMMNASYKLITTIYLLELDPYVVGFKQVSSTKVENIHS